MSSCQSWSRFAGFNKPYHAHEGNRAIGKCQRPVNDPALAERGWLSSCDLVVARVSPQGCGQPGPIFDLEAVAQEELSLTFSRAVIRIEQITNACAGVFVYFGADREGAGGSEAARGRCD